MPAISATTSVLKQLVKLTEPNSNNINNYE